MFLYGTHTNASILSTRGLLFLRLWTFVLFFFRTILLCNFRLGCRVLVAPTVNMRSLSIAVILMRACAGILQKSGGVLLQNQNVSI